MKCEICHDRDAEQAVTVTRDGKERELYVCKSCAQSLHRPSGKAKPRKPSVTIVGPDDEPPPFVRNFLEATLGLVKGISEKQAEHHHVCPTCHATWDQIRETRRFGCPNCWKTFAKELQTEFLRSEYGPTHVGLPPAGLGHLPPESGRDRRRVLERALKDAIGREDYRKAAEIQKQLAELADGETTA
ncbi:MAG: hypothetical protein ACI4Q3_00920 [Kiritimatiellia bacterium]